MVQLQSKTTLQSSEKPNTDADKRKEDGHVAVAMNSIQLLSVLMAL